jgi:hypothetical protein
VTVKVEPVMLQLVPEVPVFPVDDIVSDWLRDVNERKKPIKAKLKRVLIN